MIDLRHGDCLEVLRELEPASVDACVTDPPYELAFMGRGWDKAGVAHRVETWREVLRVLKPGGHLLAFGGTRTYHRLACAIEDAGFEIRDQIGWVYGSGFPKSLDVSKAIDAAAGAQRPVVGSKWVSNDGQGKGLSGTSEGYGSGAPAKAGVIDVTGPATPEARAWQGWGTALKPAWEPIVLARKPLAGTVAANVLEHGTGALNVDACRVPVESTLRDKAAGRGQFPHEDDAWVPRAVSVGSSDGRWPANLIHDGSDEVLALFPDDAPSGGGHKNMGNRANGVTIGHGLGAGNGYGIGGDSGSAARFFYCAKASREDRNEGLRGFAEAAPAGWGTVQDARPHTPDDYEYRGKARANNHPTVKPTELMRYLIRLVTRPGAVVLDPFMGSGSTGKAAKLEDRAFIGIEREAEYVAIARARIDDVRTQIGMAL